ncbi:hypothetical protein [Actinorugispora endophytica]|uniref:Uncharacterized protein n=1 Tax=Actinorugispora endophytica TaxID=1605990 RepID=A0A4R6V3W9_9ACTN|nr:hypothetical protein [Actinorugispora endophytica]TDQ54924.1 hypothetical protein EV190_101243 [Actinorugispora endophytica]
MPREKDAVASRSPLRGWAGIPLGAVFIGCTMIPASPALADGPVLSLGLKGDQVEPGDRFELPLLVGNELDGTDIAITGVSVTDSPDVPDLSVSELPEVLEAGTTAAADITGTAPSPVPVEVAVLISYEYGVPVDCPDPSPSAEPSGSASPDASPDQEPPEESCEETRTGTAQISADVTVARPVPTPPPTPAPTGSESGSPGGAPPGNGQSTSPDGGGSPAPTSVRSSRPSSPRGPSTASGSPVTRRPAAPSSPVTTGSSSRPDLPSGPADLPSLPVPSDDGYADLPMVTPGEGENGTAAPVAQEARAVRGSITPAILLGFLVLLLLLSAPLAPVRRVRVSGAYVGRRRKRGG